MVDVITSRAVNFKSDKFVSPFATMICNFPEANKKTPSLLSLGEVETLFHEFGHLLHMTLSNSRHESQSGANVVWDFVETPSQMMENWVMNKKMLNKLSNHYKTHKKLNEKVINKIIDSKKFQNAYAYSRQLIMGKLDLDLHTGRTSDAKGTYRKLNKEYFNMDLPEKETLFPAGFGHLVGYDAGYYSYLWALVYACDAFSIFETKGNKNIMTNKVIGMKWRREVLEKGSSEDEIKLVKNFLGREPNQKAFLKEMGVK
jgi:thimet oligopeptidase